MLPIKRRADIDLAGLAIIHMANDALKINHALMNPKAPGERQELAWDLVTSGEIAQQQYIFAYLGSE
ncbi:MAG: hypothetical protein BMS9Abin11_0260 [Gammaproteobacteria bacterium]|nr:MAG: hypothetical protein BMS9Abin11_0260 [Gammaproteobacteria bacterium]